MSKSEIVDDGQMSNSTAQQNNENRDIKKDFFRVRNVFTILISEAPYLID